MAQTVQSKYLRFLIVYPVVFALIVIGVYIANSLKILHASVMPATLATALLPVAYYLLGFRIVSQRMSRVTAYMIGAVLTMIGPFTALSETGGYGSPFTIALATFTFMTAMLGTWPMVAMLWLHILGMVMSLLGATRSPHMEYAPYVISLYFVAGISGWLIFRRFYVQENPEVNYIRHALRSEQLRSEALIAAITDGMIVVDRKGVIQLYSEHAKALLKSETDLEGKDVVSVLSSKIISFQSKAGKDFQSVLKQTLTDKQPRTIDLMTFQQPETTVDVSTTIMPVANDDGNISAFLIVLHDITQFTTLQRMKDDFISIASHELRTPMTIIAGYADLLRSPKIGTLNDKQLHYVDRTKQATQRLINLVNDMLDITKLESGKRDNNPEDIVLDSFIKQLLVDDQPLFDAKSQSLNYQPGPADATVHVDRLRLSQVIINLLSNAAKYTPENGSVAITYTVDAAQSVTVSVTDSGHGVPKAYQESIFQKFTRLDTDISEGIEGTGLGLAISKNLVESWGGIIKVDSDGEHGSRFYFTIPPQPQKN